MDECDWAEDGEGLQQDRLKRRGGEGEAAGELRGGGGGGESPAE